MNEFYIRNVLEAALLAAGKSLQLAELGQLFDEGARPKVEEIKAALDALAAEYANRGVEVKETAAGFRIQVRREFSSEVSRLWPERPARYSRALLETLALIAYRQPITRAEIEAVRGVAVNPNIVKTVIERNWVRVVGHRDVPGRPELLGTTREFLDYFGLRSLDELPPLADLKAMGDYNPQLELPSGAAPGGEAPADGAAGDEGVAAAPVAGLLGSEAAEVEGAAGEGATGEGAVGEGAAPHGDGGETSQQAHDGGDAAQTAVSDSVDADGAAEHTAAGESADADGNSGHVAASDSVDADGNVVHTVASGIDRGTPAAQAEAGHTPAPADVTHAEEGVVEVVSDTTRHSAEADDAETAESSAQANESLDALDDSAEDDADEDELSADGHGSREMVAAPRDLDD